MGLWPSDSLLTPLHVHGARTADEYRAMQRRAITNGKTQRPALGWREPWVAPGAREAFVSGGKWIVACDCGNGPSADRTWQLACCFECGAVYEVVVFPDDVAEIERLLLARPKVGTRHWRQTETTADLARENAQHGVA
jgi:hypothetical protein